jgi:GMP synthase-like glutamine amidotransferase
MTSLPILILQAEQRQAPAYLGDWLARRGLDTVTLLLRSAADLPRPAMLARCSGLILLGTHADGDEPPWRSALLPVIRALHSEGRPLLALGGGAGLLNAALGGQALPAPAPVRGWFPIALHPQAAQPPWIARFATQPPPVFFWQATSIRPPPTALTLYSGAHARCQGFAAGRALALRFHPHLQAADYADWLLAARDCPPTSATVQPLAELIAEGATRIGAQRRFADACFEAWLAMWRD